MHQGVDNEQNFLCIACAFVSNCRLLQICIDADGIRVIRKVGHDRFFSEISLPSDWLLALAQNAGVHIYLEEPYPRLTDRLQTGN
jgi:hypothetical protein